MLAGWIVKINPALITITDGRVAETSPAELQRMVGNRVADLLDHGVHTFHVDVNFDDYSHFAATPPDVNADVFSPPFLADLNRMVRDRGAFLNLHVLTDDPSARLQAMRNVGFGAMCFQLDVVPNTAAVTALVRQIGDMGACASPVIELVGSDGAAPRTKEQVMSLLEPSLSGIGLLTIQAAGTAARSDTAAGRLQGNAAGEYIRFFRRDFDGAIQLQGGVTTATIGNAVRLGAEFMVCGTEIFRNKDGRAPGEVVRGMLAEAARALLETA